MLLKSGSGIGSPGLDSTPKQNRNPQGPLSFPPVPSSIAEQPTAGLVTSSIKRSSGSWLDLVPQLKGEFVHILSGHEGRKFKPVSETGTLKRS